MKAASYTHYKALYQQASGHISEQDKMIALLQDNITRCAGEQQRLNQLVKDLQGVLDEKQRQITGLNKVVDMQQQSIDGLTDKTLQQQKIISSQNQLITEQSRELEQNKKELSKLVMVKHELKVLKKMLYGHRSEKFYPSDTTTETAKSGEQLCLDLHTEAVEACHLKDVKKIAPHLRVVKEKQLHPGRHDWPKGLDEEVTTIDWIIRNICTQISGYGNGPKPINNYDIPAHMHPKSGGNLNKRCKI